jgi:subtilisin family serine protease
MSGPVVHQFDLYSPPGKGPGTAEAQLRELAGAEGVEVARARPVERPALLEVELRGGARAIARVLGRLKHEGASLRGEKVKVVQRFPTARKGPEDRLERPGEPYPDPRVEVALGLEPGLPPAGVPEKGDPVIVAIVDSGVDAKHPDLQSHLWTGLVAGCPAHGARCIDGPPTPDTADRDGHGTRLAGTALATAGRPPRLKLMAVKFFDVDVLHRADNAAAAIEFAADRGADIILLSWHLALGSAALERAIEYAGEKSALVVIAAGNSGSDNDRHPGVPARYATIRTSSGHQASTTASGVDSGNQRADQAAGDRPRRAHVITVMATDRRGQKAPFSNYGRRTVDVAAPGTDVSTTRAAIAGGPGDDGRRRYRRYTGTSVAAAHVAGAAALLTLVNHAFRKDPAALRRRLIDSVDRRIPLKCVSGGRLDLGLALQLVGGAAVAAH